MNEKPQKEKIDYDNLTEDEAKILYPIKVQDIQFAKSQQWRVFFFCMTSLVGFLIALFSDKLENWWRILILVICFVIYFGGLLFIRNYRKDLHTYREQKNKCEKKIFNLSKEPEIGKDEMIFFHVFSFFISLAFALVLIMIFEMQTVSIKILAAVLLLHVFGFLLDCKSVISSWFKED
ncbi:MAG TPA: hypothetical protein VMW81_01285 [Nitrospinota bacterium]|nr:hypothetical protein [Nitrospinota bacterium]